MYILNYDIFVYIHSQGRLDTERFIHNIIEPLSNHTLKIAGQSEDTLNTLLMNDK